MPEGLSPTPSANSADKSATPAGRPRPPSLPSRSVRGDIRPTNQLPNVPRSEPITIWTMQDDIRRARGSAAVRTRPAEAPAPLLPLPPANAGLPVRQTGKGTKVVMKPARHRRSKAVIVVTSLLLLVMASSATVVWWVYQNDGSLTGAGPVPIEQILPATSAVILEYQLSAGQERADLLSAWNAAGEGEPSLTSLLAGDPRLLLLEADIDTFYYVLLEDEVRPHLVVRQTPRTQELFEGKTEVHIANVQGWYVINSVTVDNYTAALTAGSLTGRGDQVFVTTAPPSAGASTVPLRLWLGPNALIGLRETLLGKELTNGLLQEMSLAARLGTSERTFELNGRSTTLEPLFGTETPLAVNQQLLSFIPEEAQLVRLGGNFYQDLALWETAAGTLDRTILQRPNVAGFLQQLTGSYAFYSVSVNPAMRDLGLIISLPAARPAEQAGTPIQLTVPNPTIEESLGALLPLITGQKGVGAIEFSPNTHAGVPLQYANFSQPSQALDYAVVDNHIVITTSRESMFAVLETIRGTHIAVTASPVWQSLLTPPWAGLSNAAALVLGRVTLPQLTPLLPVVSGGTPLFGLTIEPSAAVSGLLVMPPVIRP